MSVVSRLHSKSNIVGGLLSSPNILPVIFNGFAQLRQSHFSEKHQMPKKVKTSKGSQKLTPETCTHTSSGPVTRNKSGNVTISVHAKPGSKQNAITEVSAESVGIMIAAPPTDGEANAELIRYLSEILDLKKSEIALDKGSRSREKVVKLSGSLTPEEVLERLRRETTG